MWASHCGCFHLRFLGGGWMTIRESASQDQSLYSSLWTRPLLRWKISFMRQTQCSLCHYVGVQHFFFLISRFFFILWLTRQPLIEQSGDISARATLKPGHYPAAQYSQRSANPDSDNPSDKGRNEQLSYHTSPAAIDKRTFLMGAIAVTMCNLTWSTHLVMGL